MLFVDFEVKTYPFQCANILHVFFISLPSFLPSFFPYFYNLLSFSLHIYLCIFIFSFLGEYSILWDLAVLIGEGKGNPLQYSCLENPMDRGVWWAAVHEVAQSRTRLKQVSSSSGCSYILILQFLFLYKMMSVMNRSFYFLLNNVTYIKASMFVPQLISVSHLISVFIYNICPWDPSISSDN